MDWALHVKAFQAQWIIRYAADRAASSWKNLLDSFLLLKMTMPTSNSQKDEPSSSANSTTDTKQRCSATSRKRLTTLENAYDPSGSYA